MEYSADNPARHRRARDFSGRRRGELFRKLQMRIQLLRLSLSSHCFIIIIIIITAGDQCLFFLGKRSV